MNGGAVPAVAVAVLKVQAEVLDRRGLQLGGEPQYLTESFQPAERRHGVQRLPAPLFTQALAIALWGESVGRNVHRVDRLPSSPE